MTVLAAVLSISGALTLSLNGTIWLRADTVAVRQHATWLASDCSALAADTCEPLSAARAAAPSTRTDSLNGKFIEHAVEWADRAESFHYTTSVRSYTDAPGAICCCDSL